LKVHTSGVVIREVAQQSGKSEEAFYKVIQRLRVILRDCVLKSIAAEKA
jgi:predicted secreted protein